LTKPNGFSKEIKGVDHPAAGFLMLYDEEVEYLRKL